LFAVECNNLGMMYIGYAVKRGAGK
jgi:hypothetical protein